MPTNDDPTLRNIIELRQISQTYDGGKSYVIKDLDLVVEDKPGQGQFVVLLGMSGCGKSTLLRFIAGLQSPSQGTVLVNGKPAGGENRVSMVFQQYSSLPWMTVLDNVSLSLYYKGLSRQEREDRAMEMIRLVGLEGHEKKYAQYPALSGGQLQRVAIARSLIANPEILLMDEPFGALDVKTRLQMQEMLTEIWLKLHPTIVFVTHDISEAVFLGDDIYIMSKPPSNFAYHHVVDLPLKREREIKRNPKFLDMVYDIEDELVRITEVKLHQTGNK